MNIEQPSVKDFLKQQGTWDQRLAKEQADYSEAVAKQETVEKVRLQSEKEKLPTKVLWRKDLQRKKEFMKSYFWI